MLKEILTAITALSLIAVPYKDGCPGKTVVLGDSIASGYGLPDYVAGDNYSAPLSFGNLIADKCGEYKNYAVDGRTSAELLELFSRPAGEMADSVAAADTVIISIGGNDFLKPMINAVKTAALTDSELIGSILNGEFSPSKLTGYSDRVMKAALSAASSVDVEKTVSNIKEITEKISRANPKAEIVLLTVYDPFAGSALLKAAAEVAEERLGVLNSGIKALAGKNIRVADVYTAFRGHEGEYTNIGRLDIHPSAEGHYAISRLILAG